MSFLELIGLITITTFTLIGFGTVLYKVLLGD